jgi:hypothetical protein
MSWLARPRIDAVDLQHALALPDGRTPVWITVSGWGFAWVGGTRRWWRGTVTWRALAPVPGPLEIRLKNAFGTTTHSVALPGNGPAAPRLTVPAVPLSLHVQGARLHAGLRLSVPRFQFPQEPSDE